MRSGCSPGRARSARHCGVRRRDRSQRERQKAAAVARQPESRTLRPYFASRRGRERFGPRLWVTCAARWVGLDPRRHQAPHHPPWRICSARGDCSHVHHAKVPLGGTTHRTTTGRDRNRYAQSIAPHQLYLVVPGAFLGRKCAPPPEFRGGNPSAQSRGRTGSVESVRRRSGHARCSARR